MALHFTMLMQYQRLWLLLGMILLLVSTISAFSEKEYYRSSRCSDAICRAAPRGKWCQERYTNKNDECCPTWYCDDGSTVYGVRKPTTYSNTNSLSSNGRPSWSNQNSDSSSLGGDSFLERQWSSLDSKWDQDSLFNQKTNQDSLYDRYWGRRR